MLIALVAGIAIPEMAAKKSSATEVSILPFIIPVTIVVMGYATWSGLRKQQKLLESYVLTIDGNVITREQFNTEEVTIYFHEVKEIIRNNKGSIAIRGFDATDIIYIPAYIERPAELEALLSEIKPITGLSNAASTLQKVSPFLSLVNVGLLVTVYMTSNKIVVGAAGALLLGLTMWSYYRVRKSKNIERRTKNRLWLVLLLCFFVLITVILKLMAPE